MKELISSLSRQYTENLISHRRYLHAHPEPSFKEFNTRDYIASVLKKAGLEPRTFDEACAVVCPIKGSRPGKRIAFRADMDALCMQEENDLAACPYRSQTDGVMHACGHDGHVAVLLTLGPQRTPGAYRRRDSVPVSARRGDPSRRSSLPY